MRLATDSAVTAYVLEVLSGQSRIDWDELSETIDADFEKVQEQVELRQFERCYDALLEANQIVEDWSDEDTVWVSLVPETAPIHPSNQKPLFT